MTAEKDTVQELVDKMDQRAEKPLLSEKFFSAARQESFMRALAIGVPIQTACAYAGVRPQLVYHWMRTGQRVLEALERIDELPSDADQFCLSFYLRAMSTLAEVEVEMAEKLQGAAKDGDWRAAAFWLERRAPETWGKKSAKDVTVHGSINSPAIEAESAKAIDAHAVVEALAGKLAEIEQQREEIVDAEIVEDDEAI